jgi:hypothetical protein
MLQTQNPYSRERIDALTTMLAGMDARGRQAYAAQHRNDPAVVATAVHVNNTVKAAERAKAMQAGGPMPTVVDQNIAAMSPAPAPVAQTQLPENQGIAQIPTPNMRTLADGGIAGYEDDQEGMATGGMGGMFNFAQQSEPVVRMAGGGAVPRYQFGGSLSGEFSGFGGPTPEQEAKDEIQAAEQERVKKIVALEQKVAFLKSAGAPQAQEAEAQLNALKADMRPKPSPTDPNFRRQTDPRITGTAAAPPTSENKTNNNKTNTGGVPDLLSAAPKLDTDSKPATAPTAADAKAKASTLYDSKGQILSLEGKRLQAREDIFGEKRERSAQLEAFNKEQGPAFASYEKLLQKEELQDTTDKEKAGLMSLMKGFLAMAAGESPNAATNIAKGAMVGLGDYGDALKEFKKAAKERNKAVADIENARRAEAKGDFKDQRTFEDRAAERIAASDDRFTGLISQITGKEADVAASLLNNMESIAANKDLAAMKERGLDRRAIYEVTSANARAQTPDKLVFDALVRQNNGDTVKAAEALQKMKAEKFNVYDAYSKYLAAFANKEGVSPPDPFDVFAKRFIPTVTPSKNTTVRTQPGG